MTIADSTHRRSCQPKASPLTPAPSIGGGHRRHKGDFMSPATRSRVMSRIRGRDTGPERLLFAQLNSNGVSCECHPGDLPGRPDFVFRSVRVAVFVDGDFWHGWHFASWRDKLSEKWEAKIEATRIRDRRTRRLLRRMGWTVVHFWEHQIERDATRCAARVTALVTCHYTRRGRDANGIPTQFPALDDD
jgi:DNA mismatch endonuclease (patch repair protein)